MDEQEAVKVQKKLKDRNYKNSKDRQGPTYYTKIQTSPFGGPKKLMNPIVVVLLILFCKYASHIEKSVK